MISEGGVRDTILILASKVGRTRASRFENLRVQTQDELWEALKHPKLTSGVGIVSFAILSTWLNLPNKWKK